MSDNPANPVIDGQNVQIDLDKRVVRAAHGEAKLTPRECEVLAYLAARPGIAVSVAQLERAVWGMREGVRSQTVPVTLRRLRGKIEPNPRDARTLRLVRGEKER